MIQILKASAGSGKTFNLAKEYIEPGVEKEFELKPETVKQIEEEDFSSHYDKENIEMMKKALMPSMKTRLKNSFLRIRGIFLNANHNCFYQKVLI